MWTFVSWCWFIVEIIDGISFWICILSNSAVGETRYIAEIIDGISFWICILSSDFEKNCAELRTQLCSGGFVLSLRLLMEYRFGYAFWAALKKIAQSCVSNSAVGLLVSWYYIIFIHSIGCPFSSSFLSSMSILDRFGERFPQIFACRAQKPALKNLLG